MPIFGVTVEIEDVIRQCRERNLANLILAVSNLYLKTEKEVRKYKGIAQIDEVATKFLICSELHDTSWGRTSVKTVQNITLKVIERAREKMFK